MLSVRGATTVRGLDIRFEGAEFTNGECERRGVSKALEQRPLVSVVFWASFVANDTTFTNCLCALADLCLGP